MKRLLALALALVMLLGVMAGCSSKKETSAPGETTQNGETAATETAHHDTLTVAGTAEPKGLDAHGVNDSTSNMVKHVVYDTLLKRNQNGTPGPGLAESWEYVDDLTLILHIRQGVKFHNGEALDANDIVYNLNRAYNSDYTNWMVTTLDLENTKATDDNTVEVKLTSPTGALLTQLCFLYIVDMETVEGGVDQNETPIGTGPFVFKEWFRGDRLEFTTNQEYWGTVAPFDTLVMRVITESSSRAMEIEAGGVDIIMGVASNDMANLEANPEVNLLSAPSYGNVFIGMNCSAEPFNNKTLRQAINYALDKEAIVQAVYTGRGVVANGPISPTIWGYDPDLTGYPYDEAKAKELLAEAGYPDGLEITMTVSDSQERIDIATIVQNQLGKIGVTVKVETLENATYLDRIIAASTQMYVLGWTTNTGDADYGLYEPFYTGMPTWCNTATYSNPAVDEQLDIGRTSTDEATRLAAYKKVQEMIVDDAPWVFLCNKEETVACRSNIQGFVMSPCVRYDFNTITFAN